MNDAVNVRDSPTGHGVPTITAPLLPAENREGTSPPSLSSSANSSLRVSPHSSFLTLRWLCRFSREASEGGEPTTAARGVQSRPPSLTTINITRKRMVNDDSLIVEARNNGQLSGRIRRGTLLCITQPRPYDSDGIHIGQIYISPESLTSKNKSSRASVKNHPINFAPRRFWFFAKNPLINEIPPKLLLSTKICFVLERKARRSFLVWYSIQSLRKIRSYFSIECQNRG